MDKLFLYETESGQVPVMGADLKDFKAQNPQAEPLELRELGGSAVPVRLRDRADFEAANPSSERLDYLGDDAGARVTLRRSDRAAYVESLPKEKRATVARQILPMSKYAREGSMAGAVLKGAVEGIKEQAPLKAVGRFVGGAARGVTGAVGDAAGFLFGGAHERTYEMDAFNARRELAKIEGEDLVKEYGVMPKDKAARDEILKKHPDALHLGQWRSVDADMRKKLEDAEFVLEKRRSYGTLEQMKRDGASAEEIEAEQARAAALRARIEQLEGRKAVAHDVSTVATGMGSIGFRPREPQSKAEEWGGVVGSGIGSVGVAMAAGPAAGGLLLAAQGGAGAYDEARAAGLNPQEAGVMFAEETAWQALSEGLPLEAMKATTGGLPGAITGAVAESAQETIQQAGSNKLARRYDPNRKITEGMLKSAVGGAAGGFVVGGVTGHINARNEAREQLGREIINASMPIRNEFTRQVMEENTQAQGPALKTDENTQAQEAVAPPVEQMQSAEVAPVAITPEQMPVLAQELGKALDENAGMGDAFEAGGHSWTLQGVNPDSGAVMFEAEDGAVVEFTHEQLAVGNAQAQGPALKTVDGGSVETVPQAEVVESGSVETVPQAEVLEAPVELNKLKAAELREQASILSRSVEAARKARDPELLARKQAEFNSVRDEQNRRADLRTPAQKAQAKAFVASGNRLSMKAFVEQNPGHPTLELMAEGPFLSRPREKGSDSRGRKTFRRSSDPGLLRSDTGFDELIDLDPSLARRLFKPGQRGGIDVDLQELASYYPGMQRYADTDGAGLFAADLKNSMAAYSQWVEQQKNASPQENRQAQEVNDASDMDAYSEEDATAAIEEAMREELIVDAETNSESLLIRLDGPGSMVKLGGLNFTVSEVTDSGIVLVSESGDLILSVSALTGEANYDSQDNRTVPQGEDATAGSGESRNSTEADIRNSPGEEGGGGEVFSLESASAEEIAAEQERQVQRAKMAMLASRELKSGGAEGMDQAGLEGIETDTPLFNQAAPKRRGGGALAAPADGGAVETVAPRSRGARQAVQGAEGGNFQGKPRVGLRLEDAVELAQELGGGRMPKVLKRLRALRGMAAGVFKPGEAGGAGGIELRADQAQIVGAGERAQIAAEAREKATLELGTPTTEKEKVAFRKRQGELAQEALDVTFAQNLERGSEQALKVLSHEVGHWVDYLPDRTLTRGNILGHIAGLKRYMLESIGVKPSEALTQAEIDAIREDAREMSGGNKNRERAIFSRRVKSAMAGKELAKLAPVKRELEGLIAWNNNALEMPEYYVSPTEMFADAFSAWLNFPAETAARAPIFNGMMEEWISGRPEAAKAYEALQKKLREPESTVMERIRKEGHEMAEATRTTEEAKEHAKRWSRDEWNDHLRAWLGRVMNPLYRRIAKVGDAVKRGEITQALANLRYSGATTELMTTTWKARVLDPLKAAGVDIELFNAFMLYRRIANEGVNTMVEDTHTKGRANLFNPFGVDPRGAQVRLAAIEKENPAAYLAMQAAAENIRAIRQEILFPILKSTGVLSEEDYAMLLDNWAYGKFSVDKSGDSGSALEKMMQRSGGMGGGIKHQVGTLRRIGGVAENTLVADATMARWAEAQHAKRLALQAVSLAAREDIAPARRKPMNGRMGFEDVDSPRVKTVYFQYQGKQHAFNVPTSIANALGRTTEGTGEVANKAAAHFVSLQAQALTTANLGFSLRNPFRDLAAASKLLPGGWYLPIIGKPELGWRVIANLGPAYRRAKGVYDPKVARALERHMLVAGGSYDAMSVYGDADTLSTALKDSGITSPVAAANAGLRAVEWAWRQWSRLTMALQLSETAVKLASMEYLDAKFPKMPEHVKQRMVHRFGGTPDVLEGSHLGRSHSARTVMLFYNINKEAVLNHVEAWKERPIEQSWRTAVGALPAIATTAATFNLFSRFLLELAEYFDDPDDDDDVEANAGFKVWAEQVQDWEDMQKSIPFRDRMLYNSVAYAWDNKAERKVAYVRFMDDPINGAIRAGVLGSIESVAGQRSMLDVLDLGIGDQTPNLSPLATAVIGLLSGKDVAFGFRDIVSDPDAVNSAAGRKNNVKEYAKWMYNNATGGTLGLYRFQPSQDPYATPPGTWEKMLKMPGISLASSFVRVSNAGVKEQYRLEDAMLKGVQYDNRLAVDEKLAADKEGREMDPEAERIISAMPGDVLMQMIRQRKTKEGMSEALTIDQRREADTASRAKYGLP